MLPMVFPLMPIGTLQKKISQKLSVIVRGQVQFAYLTYALIPILLSWRVVSTVIWIGLEDSLE